MTSNLTDPMNLNESLEHLRADTASAVSAADTLEALATVEAGALGRESPIAAARRNLGKMPAEERRDAGRLINDVAMEMDAVVTERRDELHDAE